MADNDAPTTTARGVRVPDDDWAWLGQFAADKGTDRASILRRLITVLRLDASPRSPKGNLHHRVVATPDPIGQRRHDNLRRTPGSDQA